MTAETEPISPSCPSPVRRPVMLQGWQRLGSVHWPFDPEAVQRHIPPPFRVDTFDGAAWVGLIPFWMDRIRVPGLPPFGRLSSFPETNIRTYIVAPDGRRGVWFMSLDITRLVPTLVARVSYHLPYCWSSMSISSGSISSGSIEGSDGLVEYRSSRRWPRDRAFSRLALRVGDRVAPEDVTDLEHFVTARWALGSTWAGRPIWAKVDHEPWPLHRATVVDLDESLMTAAGLPHPEGEPIALWSPGVNVRIGRPRRLRDRARS
jgi:uncharacterized protein YqjF (DUF2071 family)